MSNRSASSRKTNKTGVRRVKSKGMIADAIKFEPVYEELWNDSTTTLRGNWLKDQCFQFVNVYRELEWSDLRPQMRKRWRSQKNIVVREMEIQNEPKVLNVE